MLKRLLDNAVKFTPDGGQIGLEAHPALDPVGEAVDLIVWDTGIGIPADQMDRILKPFTQVDAGLARNHEGIGLSLAYVAGRVAAHFPKIAGSSRRFNIARHRTCAGCYHNPLGNSRQ